MLQNIASRAAVQKRDVEDETISEAEQQALKDSFSYFACILYQGLMREMESHTLPHGISSSQWRFLRCLYGEEGVTQRVLSYKIGLREPTVVRALARMEQDGLVRRTADSSDKRKTNVFLTAKSRKLVQALLPYVGVTNEKALGQFSAAEQVLLKNMMVKAIRALNDEE